MITDIFVLYWAFSVLFMVGYVDTRYKTIYYKLFICFLVLIVAPIMFPVNIGYYVRKNS